MERSSRSRDPTSIHLSLRNERPSLNLLMGNDTQPLEISFRSREPSSMNRSRYAEKPRWVPPPGRSTLAPRSRRDNILHSTRRDDRDLTLDFGGPNNLSTIVLEDGREIDTQPTNRSRLQRSDFTRTGIDALSRTVDRLEEGAGLFVDILRQQRDALENSRRRQNSIDSKIGRLSNGFGALKDEVDEMVEAVEDITGRQICVDNRESYAARGGIAYEIPSRQFSSQQAGSSKNKIVGHTMEKLKQITRQNRELVRDICGKESEIIKFQKEYIKKSENLLEEQDVLLRKLQDCLGLTSPRNRSPPVPVDGQNLQRIVSRIEEKSRYQQSATEALRAAIEILEERMRSRDEDIRELRNYTQSGFPTTGNFARAQDPRTEWQRIQEENADLVKKIRDRDKKLDFGMKALKQQHLDLQRYMQTEYQQASKEEMYGKIEELYGCIKLIAEVLSSDIENESSSSRDQQSSVQGLPSGSAPRRSLSYQEMTKSPPRDYLPTSEHMVEVVDEVMEKKKSGNTSQGQSESSSGFTQLTPRFEQPGQQYSSADFQPMTPRFGQPGQQNNSSDFQQLTPQFQQQGRKYDSQEFQPLTPRSDQQGRQ